MNYTGGRLAYGKEEGLQADKFSSRIIRKAIDVCRAMPDGIDENLGTLDVKIGDEEWSFDNLDEFLSLYSNENAWSAFLTAYWKGTTMKLAVQLSSYSTAVSVKNDSRSSIESVFSVFEEARPEDKTIAVKEEQKIPRISVFIGHGRSPQWTKLKSHLQDKHELNVISYESGARAGHSIRDILDSMSDESSFALLVLTGEDKTKEGMRARQNVIHECGLFQGRLGFDRAILLVEQGIELASNFDGIQQLRFRKGRISEVFGDVIATLRREFGPL